MRSRAFTDDAYGMLVPLLCLLNHHAVGVVNNVDVVTDSARAYIYSSLIGYCNSSFIQIMGCTIVIAQFRLCHCIRGCVGIFSGLLHVCCIVFNRV